MNLRNLFATGKPRAEGESAVSREDVIGAFRALLEREPESENVIGYHRSLGSVAELYTAIAKSPEYTARAKSSPFFHFHATIDPYSIVRSHVDPERKTKPGHIVNFMGVAMDTKFMPAVADRAGRVEEPPIPVNFHADLSEWAAALRAVDLAKNTFCVLELGCGWGCWMTNTSVAARRRGLAHYAIGIEGDPSYIQFAKEALATNGIAPERYEIHRGVAAARPGSALFPKEDKAGTNWGFEPIFNATPDERERALASGRYVELPNVPLEEAIGARERIDLLHMDIQGGEADLVRDCIELIGRKVAYLVIGTHSRQVEGRLFDELLRAGWKLEIERPAIFEIGAQGPLTTVDGVQGWRNPALLP